MDLTILHRSGKKNANADALSRNPASVSDAVDETTFVCSIVAEEDPLLKHFDRSMSEIHALQQNPDLVSFFEYLEQGIIPTDDKVARKLVMECKKYELIDGVLHFENPAFPGCWCIVVPKAVRPTLLEEAHAGLAVLLAICLNGRSMIACNVPNTGKE